jgi:hypothetical protein
MSKYSFARIQPMEFESMAQALLEKIYRASGNLIQFGSGQDGGREATWSQPNNHPTYSRPANQESDVVKEWVFQVKYHDLDQRGWSTARGAVIEDLDKELDKIVNKYAVPCHAYVMITNVPFTGARNVGTRDLITAVSNKWNSTIPEIYVWDAADLSKMLDANEDVRTAYIDTILTGDTLKALYTEATSKSNRKYSAFRAYLKFITEREKSARAEEAGDDPDLPLAQVFIDLTLKIKANSKNKHPIEWLNQNQEWISDEDRVMLSESLTHVRSSLTLFFADYPYTLLLGGPGLGKSTLTQFLSLYQAARIVDPKLSKCLASRLKLPEGREFKDLDASCRPRFPFRIELRLYAKWISKQQGNENQLARYIVESLINPNVSGELEMDDVFELASKNPVLLIFDGLDEVPNPEIRRQILENLQIFLRRIDAENGDVQVILSSRPKGYSGEFEVFEPITWELNELERPDFDEYCDRWLKNRIKDAEERSDAQERINRGMMAESVQRLARSLLQATVILTIVRRKVEIPHQRNSLYKKYVEVIFDREKEKSEIVREHENALLRLHERVGYELHCKMEQAQAEAIDRDTFRSYVLSVLEDYSAPRLGNKTFRDIANEIIDASTDRLCLLVGRGKDQTDVDFVVQQYREYFAALYLSNHPDAEPDRVFDMLVLRGAYWTYVLQFYVAQANANQQMRWVTGIPDRLDKEDYIEAIIRKSRTHRAILNVLPEFTLQRRSDFERAIKIIFSSEIRWTWLEQESTLEILQLIPSVEIFETFSSLFKSLSLNDRAILSVELWILAELSACDSLKYMNFCAKVQELLDREDDGIYAAALLLVLQSDLKVKLSKFDAHQLRIAFGNYHFKFTRKSSYKNQQHLRNFISYQSKEDQCKILLSIGNQRWFFNDRLPLLSQSLAKNIFPELELSISRNNLALRLHPYLCRKIDRFRALTSWCNKLSEIGCLEAKYIKIVVQVMQDPTNYDLDNEAREIEIEISKNISREWRTEYILGPSTSAFSSVEEWQEFKQKIHDISMENPKWIKSSLDFNKNKWLWTCLLFHPDHWSLLVKEKLITEEDYNNLLITPLGNILKIPIIHVNIFQGISFVGENPTKVPVHVIFKVIINILEKEGMDRISDGSGLDWFLYKSTIRENSIDDIEDILFKANNLPLLPSAWVGAILRVCIDIPEINIELLMDFWEKNKQLNPRFFFPHEELSNKQNQLLERLLDSNRSSALSLAISIAALAKPEERIEVSLRKRLLSEYRSCLHCEHTCYQFYRAVLNLTPSLEEFSLWLQPEIIHRVCKSPWMLDSISKRFTIAANPKSQLDLKQLREKLSIFVANRSEYPATIVLGALEAILKIDETNLPVLESKIWQQCLDE